MEKTYMKYAFPLVLSTVLTALSPAAFAATATLTLSATVPNTVNISVTGQGSYNNLDLSTTHTDSVVASVTEQSNDPAGYKVTVASSNAGALKNGTNSVAYTAKYNGQTFTLSSTAQNVTTVNSQTTVVNASKSLSVSYAGTSLVSLMAGTYSDILTFTITAN